jgi:uncharacterized protein (UPF0371 family)
MAGHCIVDDAVTIKASKQEIIRRYYTALCEQRENMTSSTAVTKLDLLMKQIGISSADRPVIAAANEKAEQTNAPAAALQLPDGSIVTGKTSSLLGASAALLLNALKKLAGIDKSEDLISPSIIEPVQHLKVDHLGNNNPRLHTDEILIALAISAVTSKNAALALEQLNRLEGCEAHSSVILAQVDSRTFKKLGVNVTCEPKYQVKKLYHSK